MYCEKCGWEIDDDLVKCPECGNIREEYKAWPLFIGIFIVIILAGFTWYYVNRLMPYLAPGAAVIIAVIGSFFVVILSLRRK